MAIIRTWVIFTWLLPALFPSACFAEPLRALVVLVNFSDAASSISSDRYRRFFNDPGYSDANASVSVRRYLLEASGGRTDIQFSVTDWITLPQTAAHYSGLDSGSILDGPKAMYRDAVSVLDGLGFDFSPFDNDGDGKVELFGMVHRGSDPAFGTGIGPTWSTDTVLDPVIETDGVRIERAWMITESDPAIGTMTTLGGILHEMAGHHICGLPDLYGWTTGNWGPMYGGNFFRPTLFDAFSRQACGWSRVADINHPESVWLEPVGEGGEAYRLWIDPFRETEYFLLEYRRQTGLDGELPGSGLLIWHVDLGAGQSNFLRLKQADGRDDLGDTTTPGFGAADAGDPFPGLTANTAFTPESHPNSHSRQGNPTGIRVENIAEDPVTATMAVTVTPSASLRGITLSYDETYPGFAWGWTPPGGHAQEERTAVRFMAPSTGLLTAVKIKYWGPPLSEAGLGFVMSIYDDFLPGSILPPQPVASVTGNLATVAGQDDWYTIPLGSPLPVFAGRTFIADFRWEWSMIAIDFPGKSDGRSYYRAPNEAAYTPIPYDLRIRARIETAEHETLPVSSFRDGVLNIPRISIPGAIIDAVALKLRPTSDFRWDLVGFALDRYVLSDIETSFMSGQLFIPRVTVPGTPLNFLDVVFQPAADGRIDLISARPE